MKSRIILADCLEALAELPEQSVDLTLTSPPYNMNLRIRQGVYCSRQIVKEISTKYANYSDNLPMAEYHDFNARVIEQLLRVSKLTFYNVQFLTGNKPALFSLIGRYAKELKEIIVWDKKNCQPAISSGVLNSQFEVLLVFSKDNAISRRFDDPQFERGTLTNLWTIPRGPKVVDTHGAVFPEALAEKVIANFSKVGDTILDPFLGTGTTGLVAKRLERNFIGVEVDPEYHRIASERIQEAFL